MGKTFDIYTDGGARGNPGPSGLGVAIYQDGKIFHKHYAFLGVKTNNQAEYQAVIHALQIAKEHHADSVNIFADSKLIVEQLKGNYRVKNPELSKLFVQVWNLKQAFQSVHFFHIPRTRNKVADKLANEAMDRGSN